MTKPTPKHVRLYQRVKEIQEEEEKYNLRVRVTRQI